MKFAAAYASIIFGLKSMMRDYFFRTGLTKCPAAITHHDTVERLKLWQPDGWMVKGQLKDGDLHILNEKHVTTHPAADSGH